MIGDCEMCGKTAELKRAKIEEILMNVCKTCLQFGSASSAPAGFKTFQRKMSYNTPESSKRVVDNYGSLIKQARESRNLKQSQLAKQLNEKESLLHKVESGHIRPSIPLTKKLEKFLHISLLEQDVVSTVSTTKASGEPLTMEAAFLEAMKKKS